MANPLDHQIALARETVERLLGESARIDAELSVARAKLDAFEVAAKIVEDSAAKSRHSKKSTPGKRMRTANDEWKAVFADLNSMYPESFGYAELDAAQERHGIGIGRPSLRTKMMNYANNGYVARESEGRFSITEKGKKFFGLIKNEGPAEAGPEENVGAGRSGGRLPIQSASGSIPDASIPNSEGAATPEDNVGSATDPIFQ